MTHADKDAGQFRVWLNHTTVRDVKLLTLILGKDDWNRVMDDVLKIGMAYINDVGKLELPDWSGRLGLPVLKNVTQNLIQGELLPVEER